MSDPFQSGLAAVAKAHENKGEWTEAASAYGAAADACNAGDEGRGHKALMRFLQGDHVS